MTPPWIIEPRDPLIFRDGRPIGGNAPIETMNFPYPSTVAGAVRGRMASDASGFTLRDRPEQLEVLRSIPVRGPMLAQVDPAEKVLDWLFPAPRDALVRGAEPLDIIPLRPHPLPRGHRIGGLAALLPVGSETPLPRVKSSHAPALFWRSEHYIAWLSGQVPAARCRRELGVGAFVRDRRMHVVMRKGQRVGEDGGLFETVGLRLIDDHAGTRQHYALSVASPGGEIGGKPMQLRRELAPIGGERRLARWWPVPAGQGWPALPAAICEQIVRSRRARLILATPALFDAGALPEWSGRAWPDGGPITATVLAACVPSAEVVSGWDMAARREKPTRRMASAGSVYFVELRGGDDAALRSWLHATWLHSISDRLEDRRDGFGLATLGVWQEAIPCP